MSGVLGRSVGEMKRSVLAMIVTLSITGCGAGTAQPGSGSGNARRIVEAKTIQAKASPYQLYTHCGIEWAKIRGTFWRARHRLSDGGGNPPAGWGNPFQQGTLTFTNAKTARFTSAAGAVIFVRTALTNPPFLCS
jgi:hypothetical protein